MFKNLISTTNCDILNFLYHYTLVTATTIEIASPRESLHAPLFVLLSSAFYIFTNSALINFIWHVLSRTSHPSWFFSILM